MTMKVDVSTLQGVQDLLSLLDEDPEIILTQATTPIAKVASLKPVRVPQDGRVPDMHPKIWVGDDFDDQLPEKYWANRTL